MTASGSFSGTSQYPGQAASPLSGVLALSGGGNTLTGNLVQTIGGAAYAGTFTYSRGTTACDPPTLAVLWSPTLAVSAGFTVPGLAAGQTCDEAGVTRIELTISGQVVPCPDGFGYGCIQGDWPCGIGGVEIDIADGGSYPVLVRGFDASNNLKYAVDTSTSAGSCGPSSFSVRPAGVAGDLDLGYLFSPPTDCLASSYVWYQLRDASDTSYDVVPVATTNPCGTQPIGPLGLPAGVYTLSRFEVGQLVTGGWTPDYNNCAAQTFVHAGHEALDTTLSPATASCWP